MPRQPRSYRLTSEIVASSVGAGVMCLAAAGLGRTYRLHARRPGAGLNVRLGLPSGAAHVVAPVPAAPALVRVEIVGPLEQRAGYHDPCGGYSDGHDAIADRLCAAFEEGDVLLVIDSPGGAAAGLQQAVERALRAKTQHGRRCTGWLNEMMGSAAAWWGFSLCDEIFLPPAGQAGSIGARGEHVSIAGALAQEGVVKTYFADPPDKIAFAPEFPLGPVGEMRGNRDVKIAADAFRAAVCASPLGLRSGLTPEGLIELGADMLTGQAAVDAGLADGVASEDEVIAYALKLAEGGAGQSGEAAKDASAQQRAGARFRARGDRTMPKIRSEEEERARSEDEDERKARAEEEEDTPPPSSEPGRDIPSKCGACGVQNDEDAKHCKGCGASMATEALEEEDDEEDERASAAGHPPPPGRMAASTSFAELLGLPVGASVPAQKARLIEFRQIRDHAAKLTEQNDPAAIVGGLSALARDAAKSGELRRDLNKVQRTQQRAERWALARRLVACGGAPRGKVFVDEIDEAGARKLDAAGKPIIKLAPVYAEMKLGTLRGEVETSERNAAPRNPFEPDRDAASAAAKNAGKGDTAARVERAKKDPRVTAMLNRPGQTLSLDALAASFVANNFDLQPGAH